MIIEKLIFGYQAESFSELEIIFSIFIPILIYLYFKKFYEFKYLKFVILFIYLFVFVYFILLYPNYSGSDKNGNCAWLELESTINNGQSAYRLQANRFIQEEPYITNIKISFYYSPIFKPLYKFICSLDNYVFNVLNISSIFIVIFLLQKLINKNLVLNSALIFSGLSSYLWVIRQGQVIFIELIFLILGFYFYKNNKFLLGNIFLLLFGLCRIYFLIFLLPVLFLKKTRSANLGMSVFILIIFFLQKNLWFDYFFLWFSEDGYLFGDVTTYSKRVSLFDEHLGRYAFSVFLVIRFIFSSILNLPWSSTETLSLFIVFCLILISNVVLIKFTKNKDLYNKILIFALTNFVLYPVLKPYILVVYFVICIALFDYKNKEFQHFTFFMFCILGLYGHLVTHLISSTFTLEIYQMTLIMFHFILSFNKRFSKN